MPQLDYQGIEFPVSVKQYNKIETQNSININVFGYENKQTYPIYVSKEKFENVMNLLLISDDENKITVLLKILIDLCIEKQEIKIRNIFVCIAFNVSPRKKYC